MSQEEQNQSSSGRRNKKSKGGNANKKMNSGVESSSSNPPGQFETGQGQGQELNNKEASIHDLPPEMLIEILKCLDTRSLFALHVVNRNFNQIASSFLCHRPNARVRFEFRDKNKFVLEWRKGRHFVPVDNDLQDFVFYMKKSKSVPYAHFSFEISATSIPTKFFDHPNFKAFLKFFSSSKSSSKSNPNTNLNQRIKGLHLIFPGMKDVKTREIEAAQLGDLLLNKTPFLENLSLEFAPSAPGSANVKLFPTSNQHQNRVEINPGQLQLAVEPEYQLAHLKVLRFTAYYTSEHFGIFLDLLKAAVNLKKIYLHEKNIYRHVPMAMENFKLLQSLGKFHLLKNLDFYGSAQLFSTLTAHPDFAGALFNLKLEQLRLDLDPDFQDLTIEDHARAANFISRLFESSQDNLETLEIPWNLGSLTALKFPTFKKLTELKISKTYSNPMVFPPGVRSLDIFPAVRQLDLPKKWVRGFPSIGTIPLLPMVKSLSVEDKEFVSRSISTLASLCPNLRHLRIHKYNFCGDGCSPVLDFLPVGREIWRLLTQLESLEVDIRVDYPGENTTAELDSCFTGISEDNCYDLYELREAKVESASSSETEAKLTQREHPSILDMKSLTKLTINAYEYVSDELTKMDKEKFYANKLTWISHDYAFKLMPQLKLH